VFLNRLIEYRSSRIFAPVLLLTCCAVCVQAQSERSNTPVGLSSNPVHRLALRQTKYRLRAGEAVPVAVSRETLDFIRNARNRVAKANGVSGDGFAIGPTANGDQVVLVASPTMKPGEYKVNLLAVSKKGERRAMTLDVTLDPVQTASVATTPPPVKLSNGLQAKIVPTPALIAQGWVVPGAFEPIAPAWHPEVESQFVLGNSYDSLDNGAADPHIDTP
jgi:hypothetical protein